MDFQWDRRNKTESPFLIPMSSPDITEAEREVIAEVLQTPFLSIGPYIEAFEEAFRQYLGCAYAIGVSSGTAGLHLCVIAAGISEGDLVITTPFSFVSSTNVLLFERAIPIFVDVDPLSGNIDPVLIEQAVEDLTHNAQSAQRWLPRKLPTQIKDIAPKAILSVDVFGQPAEMDAIRKIADRFAMKIIEDSCEALGAEYKGRKAGTLGDYGVFGFYPNKQITTGEGGMIVTNDKEAAQLMSSLRNQGRAAGDTWLHHTFLGYNYRLDELSAALGYIQMKRIEELLAKREQVAKWYTERLRQVPEVEVPMRLESTTRNTWFVYVIRLQNGIQRESVIRTLKERGIPARPYFTPIHLQPYMQERFGYQEGDFPHTEDLGNRSLALPFSSIMTEFQVETVCNILIDALSD